MIQAPGALGNLQVFNASLTFVIKTEGLSMWSIVGSKLYLQILEGWIIGKKRYSLFYAVVSDEEKSFVTLTPGL